MIGPWLQIGAGAALGRSSPLGRSISTAQAKAANRQLLSNCNRTFRQSAKGTKVMRKFRFSATTIFAFSLFALAGCQSMPASSCAGFRKVNLNPAATVALIQLDRPAAERFEGNDANGVRRGCWR